MPDASSRREHRLASAYAWISVLLSMSGVLVLMGFVLARGAAYFDLALFFGKADPIKAVLGRAPVWDGIWPACVGTVYLVLLSTAMAAPVGVCGGIWLAEYAKGRPRRWFGLCVDLLAGIPSIIMGLFGFALILLLRDTIAPRATTCLLLSAFCLALLVLPYLVGATSAALESLPRELRLSGAGLGFTKWQTVSRILIPEASRSILSGIVLSVGRAAEDTAVILLTGVVANAGLPGALTGKFEALPFHIYYLAAEYQTQEELGRGFGAALALLCLTSLLFLGARALGGILERQWK